MSLLILEQLPYLKLLGSCSPKLFKQIVQEADKDLLNALHEILVNVKEGNVMLTQTARGQLKRKQKTVKLLSKNLKTVTAKRKAFKKYGTLIFPIILPSVLVQLNQNDQNTSS